MIKRIQKFKVEQLKKYYKFKHKKVEDLTDKDIRELVILIARKLGLLR